VPDVGDFLQPQLDAAKVIGDPTRFVTDDTFSRLYRALQYATLRVAGMACGCFNADHRLAIVRREHQAFYRRTFHHQLLPTFSMEIPNSADVSRCSRRQDSR
jgi:hypothetical protein